MEQVLIVTATEKSYIALTKAISSCYSKVSSVWLSNGTDTRRKISETDYSLVIINAPLPDEFGAELAQFIVEQCVTGVLLLVKSDIFEAVSDSVIDDGVIVLPKPLSPVRLSLSIRHTLAIYRKMHSLEAENRKIRIRLEDLRIINRAKCVLIECCKMTEPEAHAYIEKRAMDTRQTKRDVANELIGIHSKD